MNPLENQINSEPMQNPMEKGELISLAKMLFEHIEGQIKSADSKAWLTIAANGLLANVFKDLSTGMGYKLINSPLAVEKLANFFIILMFIAIIGSIFYALMVVKPDLTAPTERNLFYFGNIQKKSEVNEFIKNFQSQQLDDIYTSLLAQVYIKAKIVYRKFKNLHKSLYFFFAALVLWGVAQLLIAFIKP